MKKRLPVILIFLVSFLILAFSFYQNSTFQSSLPKIKPVDLSYSWQIYESTSWQIKKGQQNLKQTLVSAQIANYDKNHQISHFEKPFIVETRSSEVVFIRSQKGSTAKDKIIDLEQQVVIYSFDLTDRENKTLETEQITYNTETEKAISPVFTKLTQPGLKVSGIGFEADLKQENYTFKSDVKTIYQPK